jgi:hypothetical protein
VACRGWAQRSRKPREIRTVFHETTLTFTEAAGLTATVPHFALRKGQWGDWLSRELGDGFGGVFFDLEVFDDEFLSLGGVLAHVEGEHIFGCHSFWNDNWVEADVLADKMTELIR